MKFAGMEAGLRFERDLDFCAECNKSNAGKPEEIHSLENLENGMFYNKFLKFPSMLIKKAQQRRCVLK